MFTERATATLIGSKVRPRDSTSDLNRSTSSAMVSNESNCPKSMLNPSFATCLMDLGLPAPIHSCG